MFSPSYLEGIPIPLEKAFRELEIRIMEDIVRRLRNNAGEIIRSADWQIYRLHELGESKEAIREYIKDALSLSEKELEKIYSGPLAEGYAYDEALYKAVGKDFIRFEDNEPLQQLIRAIIKQTNSAFKNITQSLGFAVKKNGATSFTPIADFYQNTLDGAVLDIASGAFDYNTVLKRTVKELTNSGLRTVDYASGYSSRVPVAARRAVMTGFNQTVARINDDNAKELETDTFEVTWHSGHRPSHWWGGGWYTKQELESVCGLGSVDGLCGASCYHNYHSVIPGVSVPAYSAEELEQMRADELKTTEYDGKEYTKYEALQRQRRLETKMRAQRQEINLLKEGGADEDDIIAARCRYRGTSAEYVRFSEAMGIPQQRERVTIDGLGNIGVGKWKKTVEKVNLDDIIDLDDTAISKAIKSGKVELKINNGKQGKHIKGHNNFIEGRSYITISAEEAQELVNACAGTGTLIRTKSGKWSKQEVVTSNDFIGYDV
ncbi:MAG: phage minor capsid protein, partial [Acutalibacteraceae bacterium]